MQNRFNRKWALPAIVVFIVLLYFLPPVHSRLAWRIDSLRTQIKYLIKPPDEAVFRPGIQNEIPMVLGTYGCDTMINCDTHTVILYPNFQGNFRNLVSWTDALKRLY